LGTGNKKNHRWYKKSRACTAKNRTLSPAKNCDPWCFRNACKRLSKGESPTGGHFPGTAEKPDKEPEKPLGVEDIAALRKAMQLTQVKFAELFGVTARKISEWEHGKTSPNKAHLDILNRLLKKLKIWLILFIDLQFSTLNRLHSIAFSWYKFSLK